MFLTKEAKAYKKEVSDTYAGLLHPQAGELSVSIRWYRARKTGDIDNRTKCILDALQGLAFTNDSQIAHLEIERFDHEKHDPRIVVRIGPYPRSGTVESL